jgi:hypothetical protein
VRDGGRPSRDDAQGVGRGNDRGGFSTVDLEDVASLGGVGGFRTEGGAGRPGPHWAAIEGNPVLMREGRARIPVMELGEPSVEYEWPAFGATANDCRGPVNVTPSFRRSRMATDDFPIPQLSGESEYETKEEEDGNSVDGDFSDLKHVYRDDTWSTKFFTYDP